MPKDYLMTKITWKAGTILAPVPPALISSGTIEKPNVMTAAWTGIISSEPPMTYVSVRPSRYSHEIISQNKEFVINLPTLALAAATDYCGVKSGRDVNKFKEMKLTALPCSQVKAPQVAEAPVSLECKVKDIQHYGTHDMFIAEIAAVNIDDQYLDAEGRLALEKAGILAYAHGHYYTLGRQLGKFGFSVEKNRLKMMQKMAEIKVEVKEGKKAGLKKDEKVIQKASRKFDGKSKFQRTQSEIAEPRPKKKYGNNKAFKKAKDKI